MKGTIGRRGTPARVKRFFIMLAIALVFAGGCAFIMGPDEPVGGGEENLSITVGGDASVGSRAITSGADLPADVLAAMRYDMVLTGPGGRVHRGSVSGSETLRLTVVVGAWRIDAWAYQGDGVDLAGTGSITFQVRPGSNTVLVPMYMSADRPCYVIQSDGTVKANFTAAFEGTPITLTARTETEYTNGFWYKDSSVITATGSSFTMPPQDIVVGAFSFARYGKAGASGNGLSWETASDDVQKMMDELAALPATYTGPRIVKLGAGTYKPKYEPNTDGTTNMTTTPLNSNSTFILREGVQVWGGYTAAGEYGIDEATRKSRFNADGTVKSSIHEAVLSGDLNGNTLVDTGDAYHVVLAVNIPANSGTVLNGLTISGGYADGGSTVLGTSQWYGGGMYNRHSSPDLVNVTVSNNKAPFSALGWGGGIFNSNSSSPALRNVTISGNSASISGGGMFNHGSSPALSNVTISNNTAGSDGGGISNRYSSSPTLVNVAISNNEVTSSGSKGGGMYNDDSSVVLTNVNIFSNHANGDLNSSGGGMYNNNGSSVVLVNVKISGNTTDGYGGGIYSGGSSSHLALVNTLISGNMATEGGGMRTRDFQPALVNVTISGNKAANGGGGVYNDAGASLVVKNSIIWGNTAPGSENIAINTLAPPSPISYSIIQGSSGSGTSLTWPGGNIDASGGGNVADPGSGDTNSPFVEWKDPATEAPTIEGIYSLKNDSPAIGVGAGSNGLYPTAAEIGILLGVAFSAETAAPIDAALSKDLGGNTRKQGTIDIGAYER